MSSYWIKKIPTTIEQTFRIYLHLGITIQCFFLMQYPKIHIKWMEFARYVRDFIPMHIGTTLV